MRMALRDPRAVEVRAAALGEFESRVLSGVHDGFRSLPFISVTEWAAEHRYLTGSEGGKYNPTRCPYQNEIQDAFCDLDVREISVMSAERIGKTSIGLNILGYTVDRQPCNLLWVMPSREGAADLAKDEIEPLFRNSPSLWSKVSSGKVSTGRTNNVRRKTFSGGSLTLVGGGSSSPLSFRTVKIAILDEVDKLRDLKNEGDADSLACKRVSTYGSDFKLLRFSKPSIENESRIERHFLHGSQARYFISCPGNCGGFQELAWELLRFEDVTLRCVNCDQFFDQDAWLSQPAEWRHARDNPHHKSFTCSVLVSPLIRWETLIPEFQSAVDALRAGDNSLMQVWENSRMGKVYTGRIDRIEVGELYDRREVF